MEDNNDERMGLLSSSMTHVVSYHAVLAAPENFGNVVFVMAARRSMSEHMCLCPQKDTPMVREAVSARPHSLRYSLSSAVSVGRVFYLKLLTQRKLRKARA